MAAGQAARAVAAPQALIPCCGFGLSRGLRDKGLEDALEWVGTRGVFYHLVFKGLQATSVLSPATHDRARAVLQPRWGKEPFKKQLKSYRKACGPSRYKPSVAITPPASAGLPKGCPSSGGAHCDPTPREPGMGRAQGHTEPRDVRSPGTGRAQGHMESRDVQRPREVLSPGMCGAQGCTEPSCPLLALYQVNTKPLEISVRGPVKLCLLKQNQQSQKPNSRAGEREMVGGAVAKSPRLWRGHRSGSAADFRWQTLQSFAERLRPVPRQKARGSPRSPRFGCRQSVKCSESVFAVGKRRLCKQLMGVFQFPINCIFITRLLQGNVMLR